MPTPILEQITQNVVTTLRAVTAGATYSNTLTVEQPKPGGNDDVYDKHCIVFQGQPEFVPQQDQLTTEWLQPYHVACFVRQSDASTISIDTRLNSIRADVEKALTYTVASRQRGGLAEDTMLNPPELFPTDANDAEAVVMVNVTVRYRTAFNDPYTTGY